MLVDRYWLSSVAYGRARGVSIDLTAVEVAIPEPDLTLLLLLDEGERRRRLEARGATAVDRETLDLEFREVALAELTRVNRGTSFAPAVAIDLTGQSPGDALSTVLDTVHRHGVHPRPAEGRR